MWKSLYAFSNHLVRLERANALPRIVIRDRATGAEKSDRAGGGRLRAVGINGGYEYDTPTLRYTYQSPDDALADNRL